MDYTVTARQMMVSNLVTLNEGMDALEAIDVLLKHRISGAPVVNDDGKFVGVFSESCCIRFLLALTYEQLPSTSLNGFVDRNPPTINEETDLLTITQTFLNAECRRLPVLDNEGRLCGQISRRDIMRAALKKLRSQPQTKTGESLYLSAVQEDGERPI